MREHWLNNGQFLHIFFSLRSFSSRVKRPGWKTFLDQHLWGYTCRFSPFDRQGQVEKVYRRFLFTLLDLLRKISLFSDQGTVAAGWVQITTRMGIIIISGRTGQPSHLILYFPQPSSYQLSYCPLPSWSLCHTCIGFPSLSLVNFLHHFSTVSVQY